MPKQSALPDAWDDDWEAVADTHDAAAEQEVPKEPAKLTKAERRAQHAELNRQIWESAENPEPMMFLQTRNHVSIQPIFKPQVKLLSRKPPPQILSPNAASAGIAGLRIDDDDSEEERRRKAEESFAERKARADKERVEKERRYKEARERLFGSSTPDSGDSRGPSPNKNARGGGKGRRRGGGGGGRDNQPQSNEQSLARQPGHTNANAKQLYDPGYTPKPDSIYIQRREAGRGSGSRPSTPSDMQQPIREPRGPQPIGRGGRGFAPRGNLTGPTV